MRVYDVPLVPAVLGLVLGPLAELQFRRAIAISEGDLSVFVTRPISAVLLRRRGGAGARAPDRLVREPSAMTRGSDYDVVVVGGGNAALCAALTAREAGARVVVARTRAARTFAAATAATRATSAAPTTRRRRC